MPHTYHREDLESLLSTLTKRVEALERRSIIPFSSIQDGQLQVLDENGNLMVELGKLPNLSVPAFPPTYGLRLRFEDGTVALMQFDNASGQALPAVLIPMGKHSGSVADSDWACAVDQSTFDANNSVNGHFRADIRVTNPGLYVVGTFSSVGTGGTFTMGVRIIDHDDPNFGFDYLTLEESFSITGAPSEYGFITNVSLDAYMGHNVSLSLSARRVSGTGVGQFYVSRASLGF